jgi:hypothetical protein
VATFAVKFSQTDIFGFETGACFLSCFSGIFVNFVMGEAGTIHFLFFVTKDTKLKCFNKYM